jgi:hypothetical protein
LDAGPRVISEFMALNDTTLADDDGDYSDWIEVHNPTDAAVDLGGWYLTDTPDNLDKWPFPEVTLAAGDYLVVFASAKDRRDPQQTLHTSFQLEMHGEYLALVQPDGVTISHAFAPGFPGQAEDVSYGISGDGRGMSVPGGETLTYHVPTAADAALGTDWTAADFDASQRTTAAKASEVLVSEAGTGSPDYFEIHAVADQATDTSGWVVAVNDEIVPRVVEIENGGSSGPGGVARTAFHHERRNRHEEKVHQTG